MPYNPDIHHRRSIRLAGYDYSQPGSYFVTICTHRRQPLFGRLAHNTVLLSPIGAIVHACWLAIPTHAPHIRLDAMVVMPDHLHGIVIIETMPAPTKIQTDGTQPGSLAAIIQNFKSVATRRVRQSCATPNLQLWQRNYYERIIRDQSALERIRAYIISNPANHPDANDGMDPR